MKSKNSFILILFLITFSQITFALSDSIVPVTLGINNQGNYVDLKNAIDASGIKTTTTLEQYFERKSNEVFQTVNTKVSRFIDDNFKILDQRLNKLARDYLIAFEIVLISGIILGNAIWYLIKRLIDQKQNTTPRAILIDQSVAKKYGLISDTFQNKLDEEKNLKEAPLPLFENRLKPPSPPTVFEIENDIKNREEKKKKEKKGYFQKRKEANAKKKLEKAEKQRLEQIKKLEEDKAKTEFELSKLKVETQILPPNKPNEVTYFG